MKKSSDSWDDLKLVISTPRALKLALLTLSTPRPQQRNKGKKYTSSKISMNVHFDFGFFFLCNEMLLWQDFKKKRKAWDSSSKACRRSFVAKALKSRPRYWIQRPSPYELKDWVANDWLFTILKHWGPFWAMSVHLGLVRTILTLFLAHFGHFLTWWQTIIDCFKSY